METLSDDLVTCLDCKHLKCTPCHESCGALFCGWNVWRINFSDTAEEEFRIMLRKAPDCRSFARPEPAATLGSNADCPYHGGIAEP